VIPPRPTELAHRLLRDCIDEGVLAIDATAGNGHDTAFLAAAVGPRGRVLAFDIQAAAIDSARARVAALGLADRVEFHHACHTGMASHAAPASVAVVMFNLGYLPGDDHDRTTTTPATLQALAAAASLLRPGGVLSVLCYPGHPEGAIEAAAVAQDLEGLVASGWRVSRYETLGTRRPAPFWLLAAKPVQSSA
jgi:predicted methyltransferase